MPLHEVEELRQKRAGLLDEMRELTDKAEAEDRDLSAEETQEFERREADFDSFTQRIERIEKLEGYGPKLTRSQVSGEPETREMDEEPEAPQSFEEFNKQRRGVKPQDSPEYRNVFFRWITARDERELDSAELRVLSKATAGAGLNLVPTAFQRELLVALRDFGVMRQISRVVSTDSGEALQWPTNSAHGTASWTAENAAYSASDETFGQATLNAYKAATLIKVSEELLADAAFDLDGFIRQEFGQRIGILENTAYVVGDGSGKPTGVSTQASAGVTAAGATAITSDELIDLYHSLLPPYRRNAVFVLKDSTIKLIRKLKDTTNQYLWQPGLAAGQQDTLLGKPVYADPDMPAATTGLVSALFGDFSYYVIRDVDGIAFQRLNELYAENGQVGFRAYHRTDGKLLDTAAVKKLTQA
jgi:HK97 family phage major capsid protein